MAITVPQNQPVTNAYSGSFGGNVTAGDSVFLLVASFNTSNVTISSSAPTFGGSPVTGSALLVSQQSPYAAGQTNYVAVWMMPNVAGGAASFAVTVTNGLSSGNTGIWALDVAGLGAYPTLDQSNTGNGSTGTATVTSGSITQAPELVMAVAKQAATTLTGPGVWTDQTLGTAISGYQIPVSSGSGYTFAPGGSGGAQPWSEVIATVYAGSGPASTPFYPKNRPVRARIPQVFSAGYSLTSAVVVGLNPTAGPRFYPRNQPARARIPRRQRFGLITANQHTPAYVAPVNPPAPPPAAAPVDSSALPSIITTLHM